MTKKHRYTVTTEFYIYAENDVEAIKKANVDAGIEAATKDNQCLVREVSSSPFASLISKSIYSNN